jgi:hypothetical protein
MFEIMFERFLFIREFNRWNKQRFEEQSHLLIFQPFVGLELENHYKKLQLKEKKKMSVVREWTYYLEEQGRANQPRVAWQPQKRREDEAGQRTEATVRRLQLQQHAARSCDTGSHFSCWCTPWDPAWTGVDGQKPHWSKKGGTLSRTRGAAFVRAENQRSFLFLWREFWRICTRRVADLLVTKTVTKIVQLLPQPSSESAYEHKRNQITIN